MNNELQVKLSKIGNLLASHRLDALLVHKVANFAWLTGGAASYVNTADIVGVASLLVTPSGRYLLTNKIEAPRLRAEERLEEQGWEFVVTDWYQAEDEIARLTKGLKLGRDGVYPGKVDSSVDLTPLRVNLSPEEQTRFRSLSKLCAAAMDSAIRQAQPGMTEFEIAAILGAETQRRGVQPIVNLIATDRRIYDFRHPLPTGKKLDEYAMLVLCGRQFGLVCSLTRLIHFGAMPPALQRKAQAVAEIDAAMIAATKPGARLGEIFRQTQAQYARSGFENEWQLHHQGGPAGYLPRETVATPGSDFVVAEGQVYAWNPSITGTKSEDTILVGANGNEILTEIPGWPVIEIEADGEVILRPATLEVDSPR
ncbi:MAG: aminopeptidase P family protein [Chloroflexi bacterium]|nr:aminopeptidase P family protein [Chloroflexota bacterium]